MRLVQGTSRFAGLRMVYAGSSDLGLVRPCNEDDLLLLPETGLFAVADGLGGLDAGDVASRTALNCLRNLCLAPHSPARGETPLARLGAMIAAVNQHTYQQRLALGKNMATTLAAVQFAAGMALAAHVGDSRIYRWRDQELTRITSDHSLVNALYEQGALTASQAQHSPQRHVITRAIGAEPTVQPSIKPMTVAPGDLLLLCTDGLTSMVSDDAIAACLRTGSAEAGHIVERLVHLANQAGGHDNITVLGVMIRA